jgi:DNA-binding NarL/FixJ family response regulator
MEREKAGGTNKSVRVLVVDDYEPWHGFVSTTLRKEPKLQIIGKASDGLEAVQQAQALQPDLILLDIGLPTLNGIEAARQIRHLSPTSTILFVSANRSADIAWEALSTGAGGYVIKSDAGSELLPAVEEVLRGKRFVSASLAGHDLVELTEDQSDNLQREEFVTLFRAQKKIRHEVEFYADDIGFVDGFARFIEAALKEGKAVIVVATDTHQANLLQRLTADGLNMPTEIEQGNYIPLEVTKTLSSFMVNNSPDPVTFRKVAGDLIMKAAKQAKGEHRGVAVCGEGVHNLLAAGNLEATITLEGMWNEIGTHYELDILCGYFRSDFATEEDMSTLERVCAEHTAANGRELCY